MFIAALFIMSKTWKQNQMSNEKMIKNRGILI
jgi:hypothetical protein